MAIIRYSYPNRGLATYGVSRNPWRGLETEIDRLFDSALSSYSDRSASTQFPVDIYEDKDNTFVRAELPGVSREDVNVELVEDTLTLTATRKQKTGEQEQSTSLRRSLTVPALVQADKVTAAYENGVLTVTLPKREEAKPKKITVAVQ
jgi:HSP20 family protein